MRAVTWQAKRKVSVEDVPDPAILDQTDAVVRITSSAICGSDLHLYEIMGPFLDKGDVIGHEAMGVVTGVGAAVTEVAVGDRVVVSCQVACGRCFMCLRGLQSQCETTQNRDQGTGASLFGYTKLYGHLPGLQAESVRVPLADYNLIRVGDSLPDERYLFLGDILPTAWQGVQYAELVPGETLAVLGLGPVGQLVSRIGRHLGYHVLAVDPVAERRAMAERHGIQAFDLVDDIVDVLRWATDGRGPDAVVDAVGTEADGDGVAGFAQAAGAALPDPIARKVMTTAGVDRMAAQHLAYELVRRGGTVSLTGSYTGSVDPVPMLKIWDKELTIRGGTVNVRRWLDDLMPVVEDPADPLGLGDLITHRGTLDDAPALYETFQKKEDGCIKVVLTPA